jgi:hypothetical protein
MKVTITFTLEGSPYPADEAESRMEAAVNSSHMKGFSELIVDCLRVTRARLWDNLTVEVTEE